MEKPKKDMKGGNKPGEKERRRSLRAWKKWAYKEI
jgi:hypothetical protein